MDIREIDGLWCDDITFCPEQCGWKPCPRNKENIRDRTIPHSFAVEIPEDCPKKQEAVEPTFKQDEKGIFVWCCGSCGAYMYHIYDGIDKAKEYAKYCRQCGKKVKWE